MWQKMIMSILMAHFKQLIVLNFAEDLRCAQVARPAHKHIPVCLSILAKAASFCIFPPSFSFL